MSVCVCVFVLSCLVLSCLVLSCLPPLSQPAAAICELVKPDDGDGGMARRDDMTSFCKTHGIPSITITQMQVRACSCRSQSQRQAQAQAQRVLSVSTPRVYTTQ
jgi:hypothetical protein